MTVALKPAHGDIAASPIPEPSVRSMSEVPAAASAPPPMADQETADDLPSSTMAADAAASLAWVVSIAMMPVPQCQIRARRMMTGMGTPSSQSNIPRPIAGSIYVLKLHGDNPARPRELHSPGTKDLCRAARPRNLP